MLLLIFISNFSVFQLQHQMNQYDGNNFEFAFLNSHSNVSSKLSKLNDKISLQIQHRKLKNSYIEMKQSRAKTIISDQYKWKPLQKFSMKFSQARSSVLKQPILKSEQKQRIPETNFKQLSDATAYFAHKSILSPLAFASSNSSKNILSQQQKVYQQRQSQSQLPSHFHKQSPIKKNYKFQQKQHQIQNIDGFDFFQFPEQKKVNKVTNYSSKNNIKIQDDQYFKTNKDQKINTYDKSKIYEQKKYQPTKFENCAIQQQLNKQVSFVDTSQNKISQYFLTITKNGNNLLIVGLIVIGIVLIFLQVTH